MATIDIPTEVFILKADGDGTTFSRDQPIGVAVTTEEEAKRYVSEGGVGYTHSYEKVIVFANKDDGLAHLDRLENLRLARLREAWRR